MQNQQSNPPAQPIKSAFDIVGCRRKRPSCKTESKKARFSSLTIAFSERAVGGSRLSPERSTDLNGQIGRRKHHHVWVASPYSGLAPDAPRHRTGGPLHHVGGH